MFDSNPLDTYSYLLKELDKKNIAFVEIKEAGDLDVSSKPGIISGKA